jgi:hypothetical protein
MQSSSYVSTLAAPHLCLAASTAAGMKHMKAAIMSAPWMRMSRLSVSRELSSCQGVGSEYSWERQPAASMRI